MQAQAPELITLKDIRINDTNLIVRRKPRFLNKLLVTDTDVANDQEYAKILDRNPENVQKKVEQYFQGERKAVQESEFNTTGGGKIKLWH